MDTSNIQEAIAVLEANRQEIGDDVATVAIEVLRGQLDGSTAPPRTQMLEMATVLVADLSGFTAMSELMDAEEVRDTVNAIWQKLDSVVEAWGGRVDKHVGDGIIALFGVPKGQEDDTERAVQAALDMQMELALFNERATRLSTRIFNNWARPPDLLMRIGIGTGPVFMGRVGTSDSYSAVGKTIEIVMELERQAPLGGVLVSEEVYALVRGYFDAEKQAPIALPGYRNEQPVYVVQREKPQVYQVSGLGPVDLSARLIGRTEELNQLQAVLQAVVNTDSAQLVTVTGDMGVGKTRLSYAFEEWLRHGPQETAVFRGHVQHAAGQATFGLMRDALSNYFEIYPRGSAQVSRDKLVNGIVKVMPGDDEERKREQAHFIGHLLGFDFSASPFLQGVINNPQRIREFAFQDLAAFFTAVAQERSAVVLLLEDLEHVDEGSLDLVEYLLQECRDVPLLIFLTSRPTLWQKRPSWQWLEALYPYRCLHMALAPLSAIDSRLLIKEQFPSVENLPLGFLDQIVAQTKGNPLFVEEYLKLLLDRRVVIKQNKRWRLDLSQMPNLPELPTLADVQVAQLDKMTDTERQVLQIAAVIGWVFWETAVVELAQSVVGSLSLREVEAAVQTLERMQIIYRRRISLLAGVPEFRFRHDNLQSVAYGQIDPTLRKRLHTQAASWYATMQREGHNFTGTVAYHFAAADNAQRAAKWYVEAAETAVEHYGPETAIAHYKQAIAWLRRVQKNPKTGPLTYERLQMHGGLGRMLLWRARLDEAVVVFEQMLALAKRHGDQAQMHQAALGLFICFDFRGNRRQTAHYARLARDSGRAAEDTGLYCIGLAAVAWAQMRLGEWETAEATAETAVAASAEALSPLGMAYSNMVLGNVYRQMVRFEEANQHLAKAIVLLRQNGERKWEGIATMQLGHLARDEQDHALACQRYEDGLRIARELSDQMSIILVLQNLGKSYQHQAQYETADLYLRQALLLAEKCHSSVHLAYTANLLGELHRVQYAQADSLMDELARQAHWEQAHTWFNRAIEQGEELPMSRGPSLANLGMARLLLAAARPQDALAFAQTVVERLTADVEADATPSLTQRSDVTASAWRVLGNVAADLPESMLPLQVGERPCLAADCFEKARSIFTILGARFDVERAYTLRDWSTHEIYEGDQDRGKELWYQALSIFEEKGLQQEVDWMRSFVY